MRSPTFLAALVLSAAVLPGASRASDVFPLAASVSVVAPDSLEADGRVPDYLKAVASVNPDQAASLAHLTKTVLFGGTLPPSLKLAMGAKVADLTGARYAGAHFQRLAKAAPKNPADRERTALATNFAALLTRDATGATDEDFARLRTKFNDAQLVELTMTTCFLNYFTRLTAGLGVTPEPWLATTRPQLPAIPSNPYAPARVTLASDDELKTGVLVQERFGKPGPSNSLGVGIPNSVRAMLRVPDFYEAWMGGWSPRPAAPAPLVSRTILLQVSLAVSRINGCRYCTVHQIVGLRKQGVEIGRLLSLEKSDDALTPEERAAVTFARKLSKSPGALTEADRAALQSAFPGKAAFEVLQQTCRFAFMNRFTDTLGLPSEDEAIHIYREVFGTAPQKVKKT